MKYAIQKSIQHLVRLMQAHGIVDVVLCPGSRNAGLVETMASSPWFVVHSSTDERSAGFMAMGLALATGRPTAVCCTSGTALVNLHPAVSEAFYQGVPLVVISGDRPEAWIGQMDGQTLPQNGVFGRLVRCSVSLPEVKTAEEEWYCNRLINEALLEMQHGAKGPVHINVPLSEPLFEFEEGEPHQVRVIRRSECLNERLIEKLQHSKRRLVVVGQMPSTEQCPLTEDFVWLGEHLSNRGEERMLRHFDSVLYAADAQQREDLRPDLIITVGGHVVSKRLKMFLRENPSVEHWHLSPRGEVVDLFCALKEVVEMDERKFFDEVHRLQLPSVDAYATCWHEAEERLAKPQFPYSEMGAVGELMAHLPQGSVLHLANSSAVRYAQLFDCPKGVEVACNRGTSGIEGSLSTALGYALQSQKLNFVVIGDLSFFYDMNALWWGRMCSNVRILLLNNSGGEIFHTLPKLRVGEMTQKYVVAEHHTSAEGWVKSLGMDYQRVDNEKDLKVAIQRLTLVTSSKNPMLVEVMTSKEEDTLLLKNYFHDLKK